VSADRGDKPVPFDGGTEVLRIERCAIQVRPAADDNPILCGSSGGDGVATEGAHEEHSDDRNDDAGGDGSTVHARSTPARRVRFRAPATSTAYPAAIRPTS
jgi:hypothetical protein